jgi:hypothetical protein
VVRQIFISHSGRDSRIVQDILVDFEGTWVKPVLMENELKAGHLPDWKWIKDEIKKSEALFVILTNGVVTHEHTQNWVAFEIGVAAGCDPPKPVFIIRGQRAVNFPVPYLNHYFSYSQTVLAAQPGLPPAEQKAATSSIMHEWIRNPNRTPAMEPVVCSRCRISFYYHGNEPEIKCPCCPCKIKHEKNTN